MVGMATNRIGDLQKKRSARHFGPAEALFGLMALVLVTLGYFLAEIADVFNLFYLGCIFVVAFGIYSLIKQIFDRRMNIGLIIASQTAVWFALPFTYVGFFGYEKYIFDVDQISNVRSCIIVILLCALPLYYFQRFGKYVEYSPVTRSWHGSLYIILPFAILQIILLLTGQRDYASSIGLGESANGSLIYQFSASLFPAVMPVCAIYAALILNLEKFKGKYLVLLLYFSVIILQLLWFYTAGRRPMAILILVSLFSFMSVRYAGPMNMKKLFKILVILFLSAQAVWFFWNSYFALRVAYDQTGGTESVSVFNIGQATSVARTADGDEQFRSNTVSRPFATVSSLTTIREESSGYLWGWNAFSQVLLTIPSGIFPNKFGVIGPVLENLYYQKLGVPLVDYTNTIFLEGYVDFGLVGFLLYIAIVHVMCTSVFKIKRINRNVDVYNFVYFTLMFQIINIETTLNTIFVSFLSIFLFVVIFVIVNFIAANSVVRSLKKPKNDIRHPVF